MRPARAPRRASVPPLCESSDRPARIIPYGAAERDEIGASVDELRDFGKRLRIGDARQIEDLRPPGNAFADLGKIVLLSRPAEHQIIRPRLAGAHRIIAGFEAADADDLLCGFIAASAAFNAGPTPWTCTPSQSVSCRELRISDKTGDAAPLCERREPAMACAIRFGRTAKARKRCRRPPSAASKDAAKPAASAIGGVIR